jgi:DNA adenine methylase
VKTLDQRFVTRAAQVIYLNKTCFNGLWRVRKSDGGFNTSFGKYVNPTICDAENLRAVSNLLKGVEMTCGSFETLKIDSDTFVYLDPPYLPVSHTSNFTGYSADGWGLEDAKSLKNWVLNLSIPDPMMDYTKIMLSSGVTDVWGDLTEDYFEVTEIAAKRNINCKSDRRGEVKELVLRNYA